jgi:hypothetical protein
MFQINEVFDSTASNVGRHLWDTWPHIQDNFLAEAATRSCCNNDLQCQLSSAGDVFDEGNVYLFHFLH